VRLTKMVHACVRVEKLGRTLVIDPGSFTEPEALDGAEAVLMTHEHPDHFDMARLADAIGRRPELEMWSTAAVTEQLGGASSRIHAVRMGDTFEAAGFEVSVHGELHAVVNPAWPTLENVGFLVDGVTFHPGDAYTVPDGAVETLLVPTSAPWLKFAELSDYVREVSPKRAYSIHDGFLNDAGLALIDGLLGRLAGDTGIDIRRLIPGESVDLPERS